jgi:protein-serine/threonine kinase
MHTQSEEMHCLQQRRSDAQPSRLNSEASQSLSPSLSRSPPSPGTATMAYVQQAQTPYQPAVLSNALYQQQLAHHAAYNGQPYPGYGQQVPHHIQQQQQVPSPQHRPPDYVYFDRSTAGFSKASLEKATAAKLKLEHYYKKAVEEVVERANRCVVALFLFVHCDETDFLAGGLSSRSVLPPTPLCPTTARYANSPPSVAPNRRSSVSVGLGWVLTTSGLSRSSERARSERYDSFPCVLRGPSLLVVNTRVIQVRLVQKVDTGKIYAMKTLRKAEMFKKDQVGSNHIANPANVCWLTSMWPVSLPTSALSATFWPNPTRLGSSSSSIRSKTRNISISSWSFSPVEIS